MSVSAETPQPQPGDKAQATIVGTVQNVDDHGQVVHLLVRDSLGEQKVYVPQGATVEVLERADDPSKDLEGTQRLVEFDCEPSLVFTASTDGAFKNRWIALNGAAWSDGEMRGSRIVGAYPGTPAAEAQEQWRHCDTCECIHPPCGYVMGSQGCDSVCDPDPEKRPSVRVDGTLPERVRQNIAARLATGELDLAVKAAYVAGLGQDAAREYVEGMSEYQAYLAAHGEKREREPRIYPSSEFAPPQAVTFLEYMEYDPEKHACRYIRRVPGNSLRWAWVRSASDDSYEDSAGWPPLPGRYREVV